MRTGLLAALVLVLGSSPSQDEEEDPPSSMLTTLRAFDDLTCALDFRTGQGPEVVDGQLILDEVQVAYHRFADDRLSVGFVNDQPAVVMDLGEFYVAGYTRSLDDSPRLDLSVFHSLDQRGKRFEYQDERGRTRTLDGSPILGTLSEGIVHVRPELGHTYLMRYHVRLGGSAVRTVKFQVVDLEPGQSITLRWAHL